jgi:hypothetical protein
VLAVIPAVSVAPLKVITMYPPESLNRHEDRLGAGIESPGFSICTAVDVVEYSAALGPVTFKRIK